jgi:hypothetical protein
MPNFRLFASLRIPIGQELSGWVAQNLKPILNGNPSVEPGYLNDPPQSFRGSPARPERCPGTQVVTFTQCHPERSSNFRKGSRCALEGPLRLGTLP